MSFALAKREHLSFGVPILGSLAIHVILLGLAPILAPWWATLSPQKAPERILRVRFRPEETRPKNIEGRLVDIMDSRSNEKIPPPDTPFLSDKNRSVERETQARFTGPHPTVAQGQPGQTNKTSESPGSLKTPKFSEKGKVDLTLPNSFLQETTKPKQSAALAPSNYLPEIAFGDQTLLNTREYAYASYFIRMKRQMEAMWSPRSIIQTERLGKAQYVTTVRITLKNDGSLERVHLVQPSGNRLLDVEALRAVRTAAPYLNPPKELIESDGRIRIPSWHFIVTLQSFF